MKHHSTLIRIVLFSTLVLPANLALARFSGNYDIANEFESAIFGDVSDDDFGTSTAARDVNCDGYSDLIVGAPYNDDAGADAGAVFIFFGPTAGGSLNASDADVILTGENAGDMAARSIAAIGDVNGDGCDDFIAGAHGNDSTGTDAGAAYVFYGSSSLASASLTTADVFYHGIRSGDYAGYAASGAGDVNGDGYDDILIGAYGNDNVASAAGMAYIIFGGTGLTNMVLSGSDVRIFGFAAADNFGKAVSPAGDFNNDGYDDILISALGDDDGGTSAGAVYLITGSAAWPRFYMLPGGYKFVAESSYDSAGLSLAAAGDVNGDGYDDFLIGTPYDDDNASNSGAAYLYYGTSTRRLRPVSHLKQAPVKITGSAANDYFGYSVASAGDLDGDGYDDILIGALYTDDNATNAGSAVLFYGGSAPFARFLNSTDADASFQGTATNDFAGAAITGAGDVDSDGNEDLFIGASGENTNGTSAGAAYFIPGE